MGVGLTRRPSFIPPNLASGFVVPPSPVRIGNTVIVSPLGNDATGQRQDVVFHFLTIQAAIAAAFNGDVIHIFPGGYTANAFSDFYVGDGSTVKIYCEPGVVLFSDTTMLVKNIYGYADFNIGTTLEYRGPVECNSIEFVSDGGNLYTISENTYIKCAEDIIFNGGNNFGIYTAANLNLQCRDIYFNNTGGVGGPNGALSLHNPYLSSVIRFRDMHLTGSNDLQAGIHIDTGVGFVYEGQIDIQFNRIVLDPAITGTYKFGVLLDSIPRSIPEAFVKIKGNKIVCPTDCSGLRVRGSIGDIEIGEIICESGTPIYLRSDTIGSAPNEIYFNGKVSTSAVNADVGCNIYIESGFLQFEGASAFFETTLRQLGGSTVKLKGLHTPVSTEKKPVVKINENDSNTLQIEDCNLYINEPTSANIIDTVDNNNISLKNVKMINTSGASTGFSISCAGVIDVQFLSAYTNRDIDANVSDVVGGLIVSPNITL